MKDIIIIPALNPSGNLVDLCRNLKDNNLNDIVVIDDGSSKEYKYVFNKLKDEKILVIEHEENRGKGAAIKTAINYFKNDNDIEGYVTVDCDGQHKVKDVLKIINVMHENKDKLVIGVRNFNLKSVPFKSKYGNKISSMYFYLNTGYKCKDTQTGLRAIPKSMTKLALETVGNRYEYEMNFLTNVCINKFGIKQVSIQTIYENSNKGSHFRPFIDSFLIYKDWFKFVIVSILSAIIDIALFHFILKEIPDGIYYSVIISTIIARLVSGGINFALNKTFTFNSNRKTTTQSIRYFTLFVVQMIISALVVSGLSRIFKKVTIIKIVIDTILFVISYFVQKRYIFNNKVR